MDEDNNDCVDCGNYKCTQDMLNLDTLKEGDCVGAKDYHCYSCDSLRKMLSLNPGRFYKDTSEYLFPRTNLSKDTLDQFWKDLKQYCNIDLVIFEDEKKEKITFISPNIGESLKYYQNITKKIDKKYIPYLKSMMDIISYSEKISIDILELKDKTQEDNYIRILKQKMMDILRNGEWNSTLIHDPLPIPYTLSLILKEINNNKIDIFIEFINGDPEVCAEASFNKLFEKLTKSNLLNVTTKS